MNTETKQIIENILLWMTGSKNTNRLVATVGANKFMFDEMKPDEPTFTFNFKGCKKYNKCFVTYDFAKDLYNLKLFKINMKTFESVEKKLESLFGDQLKECFEQETKLRITL
jgi:hypothetical protein